MSDPGGALRARPTPTSPAQGRRLVRRSTALGALATTAANLAGAVVVFVLLAFVLPAPPIADRQSHIIGNLVVAALYFGLFAPLRISFSVRQARRRLGWLCEGRLPDRDERRRTVRVPLASSIHQLVLWVLAAMLFGALNAAASVLHGVQVGVTVLIGGLTTTATTYLLLERSFRRVIASAYVDAPLRRHPGAGVAWKTVLIWGLGTGLPVAGLTLVAGLSLGLPVDRDTLAVSVLVLGLTSLGTGLVTMVFMARSIADPLRQLRRSVERIERGDLEVTVEVTDTTEVGVLQSGVNRMVEGLRERDRVRDLFGRHVGQDVARRALVDGVELGGVERHVAALFVDVEDSTGLARQLSPAEVLALLNDFFGVVVDVVDAHEGLVNKFMGDAALAVWGAPLYHPDPSGAALAAARELGARLPREVPAIRAGIGVAAGPVVAGNLGADRRLEYTVIGDAVNIASRLSAEAKHREGRVLADLAVVADAGEHEEARRWTAVGEVVLRGRQEPTAIAAPATIAAPAASPDADPDTGAAHRPGDDLDAAVPDDPAGEAATVAPAASAATGARASRRRRRG